MTTDTSSSDKFTKFALYIGVLLFWFFIGGLISWGPMLSHNIQKIAGEFATTGAIVLWGFLPFTIGCLFLNTNKYSIILLIINLIPWLSCAGWVWYKMGP